jgi:hypothetical protein
MHIPSAITLKIARIEGKGDPSKYETEHTIRLMTGALLEDSDALHLLKVVEGFELSVPLEKDPFLDPIGQENFGLVRNVLRGRDGEDVVKFLYKRRKIEHYS